MEWSVRGLEQARAKLAQLSCAGQRLPEWVPPMGTGRTPPPPASY